MTRYLDENYWKIGPLHPAEWLAVFVVIGIAAALVIGWLS